MVLNEASLPFNSAEDCLNNLASFFYILHKTKLQNVQFSRADDIEGSWNALNYADDFNFGQWLNCISDRDQLRQIKSVLSTIQCPLVSINDNAENVPASDILFALSDDDTVEVLGLGFASLNNAHGLSFASKPHWKENSVAITKLWDEAGDVIVQQVDVPNVCTIEQVERFVAALAVEKQKNRNYFENFKAEGNTDFPNLLFTESVLKTFKASSLSPLDYRKVLEALSKLNNAIVSSNNLEDLAQHSELRISGESTETMSSRRLARLRNFKHPILGVTPFEDHVKNFPEAKRMHIFCNYEEKKVCIGYFGRHLKTISE